MCADMLANPLCAHAENPKLSRVFSVRFLQIPCSWLLHQICPKDSLATSFNLVGPNGHRETQTLQTDKTRTASKNCIYRNFENLVFCNCNLKYIEDIVVV